MKNAIWAIAIMAYCVIKPEIALLWYAFGIYTVMNIAEEFLYRSGNAARFCILRIGNKAWVRNTGKTHARGGLLYFILGDDEEAVNFALEIKEKMQKNKD